MGVYHQKKRKQLINSFYGRLGIKDSYEFTSIDVENVGTNSLSVIDNVYVKKIKVDKCKESNVGVAATTAPKGRLKLQEAL